MPVYFEYLLKASICQAITFLFYFFLLKRITWYQWNRYFLLIFSILSFIVPVININVIVAPQQQSTVALISYIPTIAVHPIVTNHSNSLGDVYFWQILSAIYILVSSILFMRLFIQLFSVIRIRSKATLVADGKVKLYHLSEPLLPFSFFNSIFINNCNYSEKELQHIIEHEQVHVLQKHTIDVLLTEILICLAWCNPFAWTLKNAVRENLEFIADEIVVSQGADRKSYQYLLLKATGNVPSSITNSFKFSSLKNRILMMNKTKTSRYHLLKLLLLIPIIIFLLLAFRDKKDVLRNEEDESVAKETFTLSSLTYSIPNSTVKTIVLKEQDKCLLKPGKFFSLITLTNEKSRLKNLLERNGYNTINNTSITFLMDSSSASRSFSIQVNINVAANSAISGNKEFSNTGMLHFNYNETLPPVLINKRNVKKLFSVTHQPINSYSMTDKAAS